MSSMIASHGVQTSLPELLIYNTTVDLTNLVNELVADGHPVRRGDLATISPYITSKTRRFGDWALVLDPPNDQVARLNLPADDDEQEAV
jgi:hypothetical protein